MGRFNGTIEAKGDLIVGKGANVECDHIYVNSITVHGLVAAHIRAEDKVDMMQGSEVRGDVRAGRLRIADGVLFEGNCSMIDGDGDVEIFSLSTPEIKAALRPDVYTAHDEHSEAAENAPELPDGPDMAGAGDGAEIPSDSV
jgi:cytoskeletal protein CcmA (bactofilin family)